MLLDGYNRIATDLRISVTDRCNFRCTYCMPEEGLKWADRDTILSFDEIERVVVVCIGLGVRTVRLTGGEPLVRKDLHRLVERLSGLDLDDISLTTNGVLLSQQAQCLADAGLTRVNVSLDSLDRHRFSLMTRRDQLHDVLRGINAARVAGLDPIKINCVILRGVNDTEVVQFAELARRNAAAVRFIEYLPLDADHKWTAADVVPSDEVLALISAVYPLTRVAVTGAQPATNYTFADGSAGSIGVIPSVTEPFCDSCDRIRITADGQFRNCLFSAEETDLRGLLRSDVPDKEIADAIRGSVATKQAGHGIGSNVFLRPKRSMSMIGG